jgi:hypothetical protein
VSCPNRSSASSRTQGCALSRSGKRRTWSQPNASCEAKRCLWNQMLCKAKRCLWNQMLCKRRPRCLSADIWKRATGAACRMADRAEHLDTNWRRLRTTCHGLGRV